MQESKVQAIRGCFRGAWLALILASAAPAQDQSAIPKPEALCGFTSNYRYCEAEQVRDGLSVDCFVGDARAGQPVKLRFYVNRKPGDSPVEDLQVEHDRLIHVIGVREDLGEFFHIHPLKVEPGMWLVTHMFEKGGRYKIWSDVKYHGMSYAFAHPPLSVAGDSGEGTKRREFRNCVAALGYQVTLSPADRLVAGKTNQLQFEFRDATANLIETENFLGAPMHLVVIKDDLSVFLHAHPDDHVPGAIVHFRQIFPRPGDYKLFAQFRPKSTTLPQEDAVLAEFWVKVRGE